ncbi:MAG: CHAT domain-containing protein [Nannocystis sp.]|uniref:CHAT domain-containing protein n=1 Tax=Nannocystis sp. TaxID=1962667 RepID=UPI0024291286|nr:CHAT domain-containing protein [Nannocystis sp.]MBK9757949.1 CHAT domain-containing protein [Nannocystis sp.]
MAWLELELHRNDQELLLRARGSRGESLPPQPLAGGVNLGRVTGFTSGVRRAVAAGQQLPEHVLTEAHELHAAVFHGAIADLVARLLEASRPDGGRLLVRLSAFDPELQRVPWEAMCRPGTAREFVGASPELQLVRGVSSGDPFEPREIRRAMRLQAIVPIGEADRLLALQRALEEPIAAGAIEWLPPIAGAQATRGRLLELMRRAEAPHILHWIGHGGLDERGSPRLQLADDGSGDESWLLAETLAQELRGAAGESLRLVVLEACSGAKPGVFASAAETLARSGAEAVLAHLWPVRAEFARDCAVELYRALTLARDGAGDVAAATAAMRRALAERGAEVFSPVLYLRGTSARVFDLRRRRLIAPTTTPAPTAASGAQLRPLHAVLDAPFSLVLGDVGERFAGADALRADLEAGLSERGEAIAPNLDLSTLAERYFLHSGRGKLQRLFQKDIGAAVKIAVPNFLRSLVSRVGPGAHTTLLWLPLLEWALAERHPDRNIYTLMPGAPDGLESRLVMVRPAGAREWHEEEAPAEDLDLRRDILVLRIYGGYSPEAQPILTTPQLTEDDHVRGLVALQGLFPPAWEAHFMGWLRMHPFLGVGLSIHEWRHRMLLTWLLDQRPPSRVSVVVTRPGRNESAIWDQGAGGLFGRGALRAFDLDLDALAGLCEEADP